MYTVDLLTGSRQEGPDVTLLDSFIRTSREMQSMNDRQFFARFGEASRIISYLPGTADEAARRIL